MQVGFRVSQKALERLEWPLVLAGLLEWARTPRGRARLTQGLGRLHEEHPGQTVAVVSHGGALKTLIAHLIGLGRDRLGNFSLQGNANLSIMDFSGGAPKLTLLNDTSHHDA